MHMLGAPMPWTGQHSQLSRGDVRAHLRCVAAAAAAARKLVRLPACVLLVLEALEGPVP
eukprot:CAMPEP_0202418038 /NCGR_PEP_ID=MMETSP1128-20130828/44922_1 /ASSEMBLY_ACC=CAM_ASM_000463 /TAXON_ID=3047 /ORGANISM="Dunaliella tertiolecta, Strain CCMP1320" /LENGTH=58 /DNA_ID=CAMNT_0049025545 /DNA_START=61 /DNA_END=237 /DNA_ORIENTATION=-